MNGKHGVGKQVALEVINFRCHVCGCMTSRTDSVWLCEGCERERNLALLLQPIVSFREFKLDSHEVFYA